MARPRLLILAIAALLALVPCAIIGWLAVNLVHEERSPPRWSETDMRPLPPPDENGWATISRARARITGVDLGPFARATDAALRPSATRESAMAKLERSRADFDRDPVAPIFRVCAEALHEPYFADATPLTFGEVAPVMPLLRCNQLVAYAILLHAADSDWTAASDGAEVLVRRTVEQVAPARTLLGYVGAVSNAKTALEVAAQLERWKPGACASGLVASAEAITPEGVSPEHALKGEYILAVGGIDLVLGATPGAAPTTRLPAFAFDPGATQRALDEAFTQMEAGQLPPPAQRGLWWWENGAGKLYLDTIRWGDGVPTMLRAQQEGLLEARRELLDLVARRGR